MADVILGAKIQVTAPGVAEAFKIVSIGVSSTERGLTNLQKQLIQVGGGVKSFTNSFTGLIPPLKNIPVGIENTNRALMKLPNAANQATQSMVNLGRVVQDAPFGFLGIANNLNPLLESFQRLRATTGSNMSALKALGSSLMGAGGLGFALSIVSTALILFGDKLFGAGRAAKEAKSAADEYKESVKGIFSEVAKEATQAASLVAVLKSETETRERKLQAIKELQRIQPEIFAGLKLEGETVIGLDSAYQNYIKNLSTVIAVKIKQVQLEQLITKQLIDQGAALTKTQKDFIKSLDFQRTEVTETGKIIPLLADINEKKGRQNKLDRESAALAADIAAIIKDISELSKGVKLADFKEPKEQIEKIKKLFQRNFGNEAGLIIAPELKFDFSAGSASESFSKQFKPVSDELQKVVDRLTKGNIILKIHAKFEADLDASAAALRKQLSDFNAIISEGVKGIASDAISSLAEGIGEAFAGGDLTKGIKGFLSVIANGIASLGKQLLAFAVAQKLAIEAAEKFNPLLTAAAGIALIVIGAAMRKAISGGVGARALGGPVRGGQPYLVGERGPELFVPDTGGKIVSNSNLRPSGNINSGGMAVQVVGQLLLRGNDLVAALANANRSQGRLT